MKESDKLENFIAAFHTGSGGCVRDCDCGKTFYNPDDGWSWEDGELERLEKSGHALGYTVETISFEGAEYVIDCECWRERANKIMAWIDSHSHGIAEYLNSEKKRAKEEAEAMPEVASAV